MPMRKAYYELESNVPIKKDIARIKKAFALLEKIKELTDSIEYGFVATGIDAEIKRELRDMLKERERVLAE